MFDRRQGVRLVAGVDEAGRGCLAGPLVVAAVRLDHDRLGRSERRELADLDDSKRLDPEVRARVARAVWRHADRVAVLVAGPGTIDRDGLHRTNLRLLREGLERVGPSDLCLVDGFRLGPHAPEHTAIPGGDRRSAAIAAASVIAKTVRDRLMAGPVAAAHPGFGFDAHVGYSTSEHRDAVRALGPCVLHRRSFRSSAY
jgi:ribonuclease HII